MVVGDTPDTIGQHQESELHRIKIQKLTLVNHYSKNENWRGIRASWDSCFIFGPRPNTCSHMSQNEWNLTDFQIRSNLNI